MEVELMAQSLMSPQGRPLNSHHQATSGTTASHVLGRMLRNENSARERPGARPSLVKKLNTQAV